MREIDIDVAKDIYYKLVSEQAQADVCGDPFEPAEAYDIVADMLEMKRAKAQETWTLFNRFYTQIKKDESRKADGT